MKSLCKRTLLPVMCVLMFLLVPAVQASNLPYHSYTQDLSGEEVAIAAPYTPETVLKSIDGTTPLNDPQDLCCRNGRIYVADTGNNRVIILDETLSFVGELTGLSGPSGVFATADNVYISDTGNGRILKTDRDLRVLETFGKPEIAVLGDGYTYLPKKIAVDYAGRMYVIGQGINRGIIQLNKDGSFFNFLGAPKVTYSMWDLFLRAISTEAQLDKMEKFVPTEYNSINIDGNAFLFATSSSTSVTAIAKMNLSGDNILKQPEGVEIKGELLTDIALGESGMYSVTDVSTGKIHTYDEDGYFLFEFGGSGDAYGLQRSPVAVDYMGDKLLVLDSVGSRLTVYQKTAFCNDVEAALGYYKKGKYDEAYERFDQILRTSSNFTYAQLGIAKIEIQRGNYPEAMEILEAIGEKEYYSVAFKEQRKEIFRTGFVYAVVVVVLVAVGCIVGKKALAGRRREKRAVRSPLGKQLLYARYVIFHPFDGFWDIKHEKRGSVSAALILYGIFLVEFALDKVAKGYLFSSGSEVKLGEELFICVLTILLWCVANWSLTTLLDGKGTLGDIFTGTAYALVPYILTAPVFLAVSHMITMDEAALFTAANTAVYIWVGALLLFGMISIHDYSLSKMLFTTVLTVLSMAVILFLLLVFFNMLQTAYDFFFNIFKEMSLRT